MECISRRALVSGFGLAGLGCAAFAAPSNGRILLGGPIFLKSDDPRELAREHRRLGYNAALCPRATSNDSTRVKRDRSRVCRRKCGDCGSGGME